MRPSVFTIVVVVTLALYGLIGVVLLQPHLITSLLGHEIAGHISLHFRLPHHRVHDLTFGFIMATAGIGTLAQIRALRNIAGQTMALVALLALVLTSALTNSWVFAPLPVLAVLTLLATVLHPAGRDLIRSFSIARADRAMLGLVIIAAVPLLAFAVTNLGRQRTVTNDHAALGHYAFMAAFSLTVIGTAVIASLRPAGWMPAAFVAGLLPALLGVVSLLYPQLDSSLGTTWALAAIAWGALFVAAAHRSGQPD